MHRLFNLKLYSIKMCIIKIFALFIIHIKAVKVLIFTILSTMWQLLNKNKAKK